MTYQKMLHSIYVLIFYSFPKYLELNHLLFDYIDQFLKNVKLFFLSACDASNNASNLRFKFLILFFKFDCSIISELTVNSSIIVSTHAVLI